MAAKTDVFQSPDYYQVDDLLTEEQKLVRESVRTYVKKSISPMIEDCAQKAEFPQQIVRELGEMGCFGPTIPPEYGGGGLDYISYGLMGGIGLGFGYIVPVAVLVKWFPDRRGLITGVAVGGFGAGALVTAPIATRLIESVGVLRTFAYLGVAYLIVTVLAGSFMSNPPAGWRPEGWTPSASQALHRSVREYTLGEALRTPQWWALWVILLLNITAGISLISQESPIFQEVAGVSAVTAAGMVGIVSIGNAIGRVFWAWASDVITRRATFVAMFLVQAALFWVLPGVASAAVLTIVSFAILMCYGGGFGTMPASVADYFGSKNVGPIYGLMLTAWGIASAIGPLLIARLRESTGTYRGPLRVIAAVMVVSALLPLVVSPPRAAADKAQPLGR